MTSRNLQFEAPPQLAIAHGDATPVPSGSAYGSLVWSTTEGRLLGWNGAQWSAVAFGANVGGAPSAGRVPLLNASGQVDASCLPSAGSSPVVELDLTPQATPIATLATTYAKLYARSFGGRIIPVVVPASDLSSLADVQVALAPHPMNCVARKITVNGYQYTYGGGTTQKVDPVLGSADFGLAVGYQRANTTLAAANNSYAMLQGDNDAVGGSNARYVYRSTNPRRGGWLFMSRYALQNLPSPSMFWVCAASTQGNNFGTAGSTGSLVSSVNNNNNFGFGWESADSDLQVLSRGTGAVTKVQCAPTGVFARTNARMAFEVGMYSPPGGSRIGWWAQRIDGTPGIVYSGWVSTNLPVAGGSKMSFNWMVNTGPTAPAAACAMDFLVAYLETPDGLTT